MEETALNTELRRDLEGAIKSGTPLEEIVAMLRRYKEKGISQREAYSILESLHQTTLDEDVDDRILEVADFVAGFCSPHMKIWDTQIAVNQGE
jgi:hypothetical protein